MASKEKILDFIKRRIGVDNNWREGNCYWAARIIQDRFKLCLVYDAAAGHFVAQDRDGTYYDAYGVYEPRRAEDMMSLQWIRTYEYKWYRRLMRECRD